MSHARYARVQATVGVGTVLIWDFGVAYTKGGGYLTRDTCNHDQIPEQRKVPVKSQPPKPATKRAGPSCTAYLVIQLTEHVQEFKVVRSRKKKFHTVPVERAHTQK